jgi:hypothetical protein
MGQHLGEGAPASYGANEGCLIPGADGRRWPEIEEPRRPGSLWEAQPPGLFARLVFWRESA